jgi:hypothetical protein
MQPHIGLANHCSLSEILTFLYQIYGKLTPHDLKENDKKFRQLWDLTLPFETKIKEIKDCMDVAEAGESPYQPCQIMDNAYNMVHCTGLYFNDLKEWKCHPADEQIWANFKMFMIEKQNELHEQQQTQCQAGYHGTNFMSEENFNMATEALTNLATASTADHKALETMTNMVANLTQQVKEKDDEIKKLKEALATAKHNTNNNHCPNKKDNGSYCWTHGYLVAKNHTSVTCNAKATGHKDEATCDNNMGGSQDGKPKN